MDTSIQYRCTALLLFLLLFCLCSSAQDEKFASDRPGLSDAPDLIARGKWQIATGFDWSQYNHYRVWQLSTNTLKYGISRRLEARMDFGMQYDKTKKIFGTVGPSLGIKGLLLKGRKIIPKAVVIIEYYPPPFSEKQYASGMAAEFCFANNWGHNSIYYNAGYDWIDITMKGISNFLLGYQRQFNRTFAAFTEFYIFNPPRSATNYVADLGMTCQFSKKLQLDLTIGLDLSRPKGNSFSQGGFTYNF